MELTLMTNLAINGAHRYAAVDRCIYCGARGTDDAPLGEEHVIPSGLGGTLLLPDASCKDCEGFTSFCELRMLRGILNPIRSYLGARGKRRKPTRASAFPVTFSGHAVSEDVALAEYPVSLVMPILERPGFLVGRDPAHYDPGAVEFQPWVAPDAEAQASKLMQERGVTKLEVTHELHPREFIKFLAKVAHSFAIAERVDFEPLLTNLIRSPRDASIVGAFPLIGCAEEPAQGFPPWRPGEGGHRVAVMRYPEDGPPAFYSVLIQLFRLAQSPTYEVIVGTARGVSVRGLSNWVLDVGGDG